MANPTNRDETGPGRNPRRAPTKRELKALQTRERIREAAGALFIDKGFDRTTVDEIAAAAGVAKGTFYLHFPRKEDLALEYAENRLRLAAELLPKLLLLPTVRESLHEMVRVVLKGKGDRWHPEIVKHAVLELAASYDRLQAQDLRRLLLPVIELGISRDQVRTDIPAATLAGFAADTIYGGLRNWGMGLVDGELDEIIDHSVTLAYDGIRRRE